MPYFCEVEKELLNRGGHKCSSAWGENNENVLKLIAVLPSQYSVNILKTTEKYTLNAWTFWYANYISVKLLKRKPSSFRDFSALTQGKSFFSLLLSLEMVGCVVVVIAVNHTNCVPVRPDTGKHDNHYELLVNPCQLTWTFLSF